MSEVKRSADGKGIDSERTGNQKARYPNNLPYRCQSLNQTITKVAACNLCIYDMGSFQIICLILIIRLRDHGRWKAATEVIQDHH